METTAARPAVYQEIPLEQIAPAPHQARKDFDPDSLKSLADSMKEAGLIEPIVVRQSNGSFELISGERRLRAAKLLLWPTIEARVIQTVSEADAAAKGLVENLERQDLNPIEEAEGIQTLNRLDPGYWTQEKIGRVVGKSQTYVSRSSGLQGLPDDVKESMRRRIISRDHGIELLRLSDSALQSHAAQEIMARDLSRGETRKLVDQMLGKQSTGTGGGEIDEKSSSPIAPHPSHGAQSDLDWKGEEIAINRRFKPASESVRDYIAWLTLALEAFAETKPISHNGHAGVN